MELCLEAVDYIKGQLALGCCTVQKVLLLASLSLNHILNIELKQVAIDALHFIRVYRVDKVLAKSLPAHWVAPEGSINFVQCCIVLVEVLF